MNPGRHDSAPAVTEKQVQRWLFERYSRCRHTLIVPNAQMYGWEIDLVTVITASGMVVENEIKLTRSDFLADKRKQTKHTRLQARKPLPLLHHRYFDLNTQAKHPVIPNYFRYVLPQSLGITAQDVPIYAGLLVFRIQGWVRWAELKRAPRLHREAITPKQRACLADKLMYRFWSHAV